MKITPLPKEILPIGLGMTLADGDILTWDSATGTWTADPGVLTLGGDLAGTLPNPTIANSALSGSLHNIEALGDIPLGLPEL